MVYFPTFTSDLVRFTGVKAGLECMISCVSIMGIASNWQLWLSLKILHET